MVADVVLAVLAIAALAILLASAFDAEPAWVLEARAALAEARHRAAGVLAEFGDWLRLGR